MKNKYYINSIEKKNLTKIIIKISNIIQNFIKVKNKNKMNFLIQYLYISLVYFLSDTAKTKTILPIMLISIITKRFKP